MLESYGQGTHGKCKECGRKIFITEADVTVRDGKRWVELKCANPGCVAYDSPHLYDEDALEIHGTSKRYEYVKVKGSSPEVFLLVLLDPGLPSGTFVRTGERAISEAALRAELNKEGRSEAEINSVIERARKNEA